MPGRGDVTATELPPALAAAREVRVAAYMLDLDGSPRLALTPAEAAPLLGMDDPRRVIHLIRSGALRARNTHPGSRNPRYLISVGALVEYLDGRDEPVPAAYG